VIEGGVYTAAITFDGSGDVVGLAAQPVSPAVPVGLVLWTGTYGSGTYFGNDLGPDLWEHDWAPSGTQLVYNRFSAEELWVATVGGAQGLLSAASWIRTPA
jgi:hypothetical protein